MIQQQYYTRERRGLFRGSEGYDSIAKSNGLEDTFIKEQVHPFCVYNASKALQLSNASVEDYPKAYTLIHYPDGRMLLGQAAYVSADFTGQRATFFAHNYVLPKEAAEPIDIEALLFDTAFVSSYDIEQGKELLALATLPRTVDGSENRSLFGSLRTNAAPVLIEQLRLDRTCFYKLVQCLFISISSTKKTFVMPPVETKQITDYARALLSVLYRYLPKVLTQPLGFVTYSREPENKKGLHLMFLEKGAARTGDPRLSRDFLLDFDQGLKNEPPVQSSFLDYIWDRMMKGKRVDSFYAFANAFPSALTLDITHWNNLMDIYRVYTDMPRMDGYTSPEKQHIFYIVKQYLPLAVTQPESAQGAAARSSASRPVNMTDFAAKIVLNEAKAILGTAYTSSRSVMEEIAGYYALPIPRRLVVQALYLFALKNPSEHFFTADLIRGMDATFLKEYVNLLSEKNEIRMLDAYFDVSLPKLPLHLLFIEMAFWLDNMPEVFYSPSFIERVCNRVKAVMAQSQDAVTTANLAYQALKTFRTEKKPSQPMPSFDRFLLSFMDAVDAGLTPRLDFNALTPGQLLTLPHAFIQRGKDSGDPAPFLTLEILKKISVSLGQNEIINFRYFVGSYRLDQKTLQFIVMKLREFCIGHIDKPQFENIVFLFRNINRTGLDADSLLSYINDNGGALKGAFIVWATEKHVFNPQNIVHSEAVKNFVRSNIKDAAFKETIYENPELKTLARELRFGRLAGML